MSKNKTIAVAIMMMIFATSGVANAVQTGPFGYDLQKDIHRSKGNNTTSTQRQKAGSSTKSTPSTNTANGNQFYSFVPMADLYSKNIDSSVYYPNATINSAIAQYKKGNYTECLQHLYSYIKKHPADAYAFYYMGMAYTKLGENNVAKNCYQKAINCNATGRLLQQALKGRDCITGGTYCHAFDTTGTAGLDPLDAFINAPYEGNGFSPELEREFKQKQLNNLQKQMNKNNTLTPEELEKLQDLQNDTSEGFIGEKLAMAANVTSEPTSSEVMDAIDVLKRAGLNITANTVETSSTDAAPAKGTVTPSDFMPNQELQQLNMMLGGNNNNNDSMMNMVPYMMNANNNGQSIDPQVIQTMMMSSMMGSLNNINSNDNK